MNSRDLNGYGRMSSSDSSSGSNGCSVETRVQQVASIRVEVTEPITHTDSKHVLYQMEITCPGKSWHTMKRYSEFYKLYEQVSCMQEGDFFVVARIDGKVSRTSKSACVLISHSYRCSVTPVAWMRSSRSASLD